MAPCKNCIYGGIKMDWKTQTVLERFKSADKVVGVVWKTIDYEAGDVGCRMTAFQSKEDVCLNNGFSEAREFIESA